MWSPVRDVSRDQRCVTCLGFIRKGGPGTKTGTRGTRAFYNAVERVWECIGCQTARVKVDDARACQADLFARAEEMKPGTIYDVTFNRHGGITSGIRAFAEAYHAGKTAALRCGRA